MQKRHKDRQCYFNELANTSRSFYIDYVKQFISLSPSTHILEIGCGEGGNLLPFAELGCKVTGIDRAASRIHQAETFFTASGYKGEFTTTDFFNFSSASRYNPQIQISAESETKRSIFREKDKTKRSKKESAQHSKSRNKSFVMTSVSAL